MKLLPVTILLLIGLSAFAQKQNVYFLKEDGHYVDHRDSADIVRVVQEPDSGSKLYKIFEFYAKGNTRRLIGKSSMIDPPHYQGSCIEYYKTGKHKATLYYVDNMLAGDQFEFYPNGKFYKQLRYPDKPTPFIYTSEDFLIWAESDSTGNAMVTNGNGYYKGYDGKFKNVADEGSIKDGKRDSTWKGTDEGFKLKFVENYANGKLISGISIAEKGDTVKYTGARLVEPNYKGGMEGFYKFVSHYVRYPRYEKEHNIQGKVILSFVVEKDGSIGDIKVLSHVSEGIDQEAIDALKAASKWIPGRCYGRNVRSQYSIPINFTLSTY